MFLAKEKLQHVNSITHEGKVVVFATDDDGAIYYTIKQDGFEDSYLNTPADQRTGWEDWKTLEFPLEEDDDLSVIAKEKAELTDENDTSRFILRSRYRTRKVSAVAPVQLVSGMGHIYVFRQSKADATEASPNTLLVDRFVLDGMTNKLERKLQVRFKRSRQQHKPTGSQRKGSNGQLVNVDSLDFRDAENNLFYEPTTELSLIDNLHDGWFSVVLLPTNEHDNHRWHIFAYNTTTQKVELTSIRASAEGLFDVKDYTVLEPRPEAKGAMVPRSIPGLIRRTLDLNGVQVSNGLAATKYDIHREQQTKEGAQLLKGAIRVMLAVPTTQGPVAALSFSVAADGTLSQIDENPDGPPTLVRSNARDVLLPLNTLDEIKAIGDSTPPPEGTISKMERGDEDKVRITTADASQLASGDVVKITDTNHYNGHYVATNINGDTFDIAAAWVKGEMGDWEVVPEEETGLIFDGVVTAVERVADGTLRVTAVNHGLDDGDEVQIVDTEAYNKNFPVKKLDDQHFTIEGIRWQQGEAVNLKLESRKRRGVMFNGTDEYIELPALELTPPSEEFSFGYTVSAWVYVPALGTGTQVIVGETEQHLQLVLHNGTVALKAKFAHGVEQIEDIESLPTEQWMHFAGTLASDGASHHTTLMLCKNGQPVGTPVGVTALPETPEAWEPAFEVGKAFAGKIADVRIWDTDRTPQLIKDTMYLRLTGREVDLAGYWRLGAIAEGDGRKVVDFSIHGNDGVVHGDAFVSAITLSRTLGDGTTEAVKYRNDDLVAVSARATYLEGLEFKIDAGVDPNDIDGKGTKLFTFSYWGKRSRGAQERIEHQRFTIEQSDFQDLGDGWYSATCRFTVPDEVAMLRCFELAYVVGDWSTLEVRKHRIRLVSETITEARYTDHVTLETLADELPAVPEKLTELAQKEQEEAALLEEKRDLEERLALLEDLGLLQQRLEQIKRDVPTLKDQEQQLYIQYLETSDPFRNKWVELRANTQTDDGTFIAHSNAFWSRSSDYIQCSGSTLAWNEDYSYQWRLVRADATSYYIYNKGCGDFYRLRTRLEKVYPSQPTNDDDDKWVLVEHDGRYYIYNKSNPGCKLTSHRANNNSMGSVCIDYHQNSSSDSDAQLWYLRVVSSQPVNQSEIDATKARWEAKQQERKSKEQERDRLQEILDGSDLAQKTAWQNRLDEITNILLPAIQTAIAALNTALLNTINDVQQTPQAMPAVHTVSLGAQKGLITKGALLGFAAPASRLTALETCEGNVQLSYFDDRGCMRQTNFDATADSQNAAFEQWTPNALPVCLNFADSNDVLTLDPAVSLRNESTVEAWFAYPLPQTTLWNTLAGSQDGPTQIVAYNGQWLGLRADGFFHNSGYNLESLSHGWHHLAVAGKVEKGKDTTTFYIDGKQVGETVQSRTALAFNGQAEYVQVANHTNSRHALTVSCWAKSNTESWNGDAFLVSKRDAYILYPGKDTKSIKWYIYSGGWKSISFTPNIDLTEWHHYAGTFDGNTVCLYIDGVCVVSKELFTSSKGLIDADTGPLYLGHDDVNNSYFNGSMAEVCILDYAQLEEQIQANMGLLLEGKEPGLVGYWRLTDAAASDLSPGAHNGTLKGTPSTVRVTAAMTGEVQTIGNRNTGAAPFGKVSEVRLWQTALSKEEVAVNSKTRLTGNEPGLAAYYPLDEAAGTEVRDHTGNGHAGTVLGASWRGCVAPIGNLGHQVMLFDGKNDFVNVPTLAAPQQQGTIEAWIYADYDAPPSGHRTIVEFGDDSPHFGLHNGQLSLHDGATSSDQLSLHQWVHVAAVWDASGSRVFVDGLEAATGSSISPTGTGMGIGFQAGDNHFKGRIAEVRIWNNARTQQAIRADRLKRLAGHEAGLVGYWPLDEIEPEGATTRVLDHTGNGHHGTLVGSESSDGTPPALGHLIDDNALPIGGGALVCNEYSTVSLDPVTGKKQAMMQRFFASPVLGGAALLPEKRVEFLELKWIGNAQFAPTLLGYIEGPPPIPSENLTVEDDYNGATSVELAMSEDVAFSWNRAQDVGLGGSLEGFLGGAGEIHAGVGMEQQVGEWKTGFKGHLDLGYQWQNESNISSSSSQSMTDRLELRGTQEPGVKFPHLGKRFIPKNVGYALVISSMADVFITRLKRSKRMVGYQVSPVDGIQPDVNTITFLMNPAYTMSGSVDGQTGSSPTSNRFFQHVPEMRAQYGSLYPASYFRLKEAYDLKEKIDADDKRRASYFAQFNAGLVDETSLERNIDSGEAPQAVSVTREEDKPDEDLTEEEKQAAQDAKLEAITDELGAATEQQSQQVEKKQTEIDTKIADQKTRVHATDSFAWWQKRMEDLQIKAGKRNIVNTYVWDADGGLRTEAQSFANTAEHTIGGSFALDAGLGAAAEAVAGAAVEMTALVTINLTQTMNKTESRSKGFELNVDLSGVESRGITDYNDYPIQPGEKVDRYRFMSFYLEGTTNNFNDFFAYVVDPEWLASNDEEARALRQARGRANKTWRVLHRVTYVERPALMGFGRDYRKQEQAPDVANRDLLEYLEARLTTLDTKIDELVPVSTQGSQTATAQNGESATTDEPAVNLNTASVEVLEMLPGISLSLAQAVVETRQQQAFTSLEDIERVSGIGPSLRRKLEGLVTW